MASVGRLAPVFLRGDIARHGTARKGVTMKMLRHYFISDDLDDLESFEEELENGGVHTPQIHVLSLDDTGVETHHHLHEVQALMKKDLIHSTEYGLLVGVCVAASVLAVAYFAGWTGGPAGWTPFVFLSIVCVAFFTWEGGLWGIQRPNSHFQRFEEALQSGRHVFFVDVEPNQEAVLDTIYAKHPTAKIAGTGTASPHWIVVWHYRLKRFLGETMP